MDKQHKKIINAWAMYDWANSAFATTIMAAVYRFIMPVWQPQICLEIRLPFTGHTLRPFHY
jgi:hypothetical protein